MVNENMDLLSVLRSILARLDQENLHLAAIYIEKAIEVIERGEILSDRSSDEDGK
jgi:hypothetical protein